MRSRPNKSKMTIHLRRLLKVSAAETVANPAQVKRLTRHRPCVPYKAHRKNVLKGLTAKGCAAMTLRLRRCVVRTLSKNIAA
jgi:hypothetical protein